MKALSIILKILMLTLAAIWGLGCGILFPVFILAFGENLVPAAIASDHVIIVWLVTGAAGFVLPAVLTMCGFCKTASALSLLGFCGVLYVYARFAQLYAGTPGSSGPAELYLPCIFITLTILGITVIENREKIKALIDKKSAENEKAAPSIFADREDK